MAEEGLLEKIRELGPISTPDLYRSSNLSKKPFDKALKKLRQKMRVAIVEIKHETKTKHIYTYDLTERWIPELTTNGDITHGDGCEQESNNNCDP